ncbi:MAG: putative baseplate assembly protein [Alkalinema sp. RU_4_3]|nr:putative baseplate assembly protein [Alkalinema sp. RU_4_3]
MKKVTPNLDRRTQTELMSQLQELFADSFNWDATKAPEGNLAAVTGVFIHFCETIIQRLNQVPDKNFLAFLDLLGADRLPPQPARVPLTFFLAKGSTIGIVPTGTQVAAPPTAGEEEPVIYETERPLVVTATELKSAIVRDLELDRFQDYSEDLDMNSSDAWVSVFQGDRVIAHRFYLAQDELLSLPGLQTIRLEVGLAASIPPHTLLWEYWDGDRYRVLQTTTLTQSTTFTFTTRDVIAKPTKVQDVNKRWLRCSLVEGITIATSPKAGMVQNTQLPTIRKLAIEGDVNRSNIRFDAAFVNQSPVDLNKPFQPFGDRPKIGDTLYLASREGLAWQNTTITLNLNLGITARRDNALQLAWEFWNGQSWQAVSVNPAPDVLTNAGDRAVTLLLPSSPKLLALNGVENYWIRVRIVAGGYGSEAGFQLRITDGREARDTLLRQIIDFTPATFLAPLINTINFNYSLTVPNQPIAQVITENNLSYKTLSIPFSPFETDPTPNGIALHLGFQRPKAIALINQPLSLFVQAAAAKYQERDIPLSPRHSQRYGEPNAVITHTFWITNPSATAQTYQIVLIQTNWPGTAPAQMTLNAGQSRSFTIPITIPQTATGHDRAILSLTSGTQTITALVETIVEDGQVLNRQPQLKWQYWNGKTWNNLTVEDETKQLTRSGLITLLPPEDWTSQDLFGKSDLHWLRSIWESGSYEVTPKIKRLLTNTMLASQTTTLQSEPLGVSDGMNDQRFKTTQFPVLTGQQLEVQEGDNWIPWQEVPDFYGSQGSDRHYTLNHLTGDLQFGGGSNGRVPPPGSNLRMTQYQTGGGDRGNRPTREITQLKTTIPYVDRVINLEPAAGGANAESLEAFMDRAPKVIRHGNRAVTVEDFEDLALLASPAVARARCVPLLNLKRDPLAIAPNNAPQLGEVSVIIVPNTIERLPNPSLELIERVKTYLEAHCSPTLNLSVVGPLYIEVSVTVEIVPVSLSLSGTVERQAQETLSRFLHPLTGGFDGKGWFFGRRPHRSDLYALLESIPNIDHIHSLRVTPTIQNHPRPNPSHSQH